MALSLDVSGQEDILLSWKIFDISYLALDKDKGFCIASPLRSTLWVDRELEATHYGDLGVTHEYKDFLVCLNFEYFCGIYSYKLSKLSKTKIFNYFVKTAYWELFGTTIPPKVVGVVSSKGLVLEGTNGYRSQHVRLEHLYINPDVPLVDTKKNKSENIIKSLSDRYHVPVEIRK